MLAAGELLRAGLLDGIAMRLVTAPLGEDGAEGPLAQAVRAVCEALGARVDTSGGEPAVLVLDGDGLFAASGLHGCLAGAWEATHAAVNEAFLPAARGGRIVYLAPAPGAGPGANAARAGLENLARTLSVEWARHRITTVTIALGDATAPGEAAALTAYLASPASAYFSGCQLDLRGV